ncbi:MAG TPA: hypothetical protein VHV49_12095 [Pseudonocardiaceae bacterium]|nr:hypothetical protein [Pseudonocardiaceae bacterium]
MHPADATPSPVPGPPPGDRVDRDTVIAHVEQAVDRLSGLDALPVTEHVARFEATHATLTDALSSIDKV